MTEDACDDDERVQNDVQNRDAVDGQGDDAPVQPSVQTQIRHVAEQKKNKTQKTSSENERLKNESVSYRMQRMMLLQMKAREARAGEKA